MKPIGSITTSTTKKGVAGLLPSLSINLKGENYYESYIESYNIL
ncbi:hypothetical protein VPHK460_0118 [Vibrio phage K460]